MDADQSIDSDNDFGFRQPAGLTLGDFVWYDTDQDGIQDAGEPGLSGIAVALHSNWTCTGGPAANGSTNGSGIYGFSGLAAGNYCLSFMDGLPAGWTFTNDNLGPDDTVDSDASGTGGRVQYITLGADDSSQDAGMYVQGTITEVVWCDTNGNRTLDAGEGVGGVTVDMFEDPNCDGGLVGVSYGGDT